MGKRFEKLGEHTVCEDGETTPVLHMWFKEGGVPNRRGFLV